MTCKSFLHTFLIRSLFTHLFLNLSNSVRVMMNFFFFLLSGFMLKNLLRPKRKGNLFWEHGTQILICWKNQTQREVVLFWKKKNNQIKDCVVLPRMQTTLLIMLTRLWHVHWPWFRAHSLYEFQSCYWKGFEEMVNSTLLGSFKLISRFGLFILKLRNRTLRAESYG